MSKLALGSSSEQVSNAEEGPPKEAAAKARPGRRAVAGSSVTIDAWSLLRDASAAEDEHSDSVADACDIAECPAHVVPSLDDQQTPPPKRRRDERSATPPIEARLRDDELTFALGEFLTKYPCDEEAVDYLENSPKAVLDRLFKEFSPNREGEHDYSALVVAFAQGLRNGRPVKADISADESMSSPRLVSEAEEQTGKVIPESHAVGARPKAGAPATTVPLPGVPVQRPVMVPPPSGPPPMMVPPPPGQPPVALQSGAAPLKMLSRPLGQPPVALQSPAAPLQMFSRPACRPPSGPPPDRLLDSRGDGKEMFPAKGVEVQNGSFATGSCQGGTAPAKALAPAFSKIAMAPPVNGATPPVPPFAPFRPPMQLPPAAPLADRNVCHMSHDRVIGILVNWHDHFGFGSISTEQHLVLNPIVIPKGSRIFVSHEDFELTKPFVGMRLQFNISKVGEIFAAVKVCTLREPVLGAVVNPEHNSKLVIRPTLKRKAWPHSSLEAPRPSCRRELVLFGQAEEVDQTPNPYGRSNGGNPASGDPGRRKTFGPTYRGSVLRQLVSTGKPLQREEDAPEAAEAVSSYQPAPVEERPLYLGAWLPLKPGFNGCLNTLQVEILHRWAGNMKDFDPARGSKERIMEKWSHIRKSIPVDDLRFTHERISENFTHGPHQGQPYQALYHDLAAGKVHEDEVTPLVVVHYEDHNWVICGNRRLRALRLYQWAILRPVQANCLLHDLEDAPRNVMAKFVLAMNTADGSLPGVRKHAGYAGGPPRERNAKDTTQVYSQEKPERPQGTEKTPEAKLAGESVATPNGESAARPNGDNRGKSESPEDTKGAETLPFDVLSLLDKPKPPDAPKAPDDPNGQEDTDLVPSIPP